MLKTGQMPQSDIGNWHPAFHIARIRQVEVREPIQLRKLREVIVTDGSPCQIKPNESIESRQFVEPGVRQTRMPHVEIFQLVESVKLFEPQIRNVRRAQVQASEPVQWREVVQISIADRRICQFQCFQCAELCNFANA